MSILLTIIGFAVPAEEFSYLNDCSLRLVKPFCEIEQSSQIEKELTNKTASNLSDEKAKSQNIKTSMNPLAFKSVILLAMFILITMIFFITSIFKTLMGNYNAKNFVELNKSIKMLALKYSNAIEKNTVTKKDFKIFLLELRSIFCSHLRINDLTVAYFTVSEQSGTLKAETELAAQQEGYAEKLHELKIREFDAGKKQGFMGLCLHTKNPVLAQREIVPIFKNNSNFKKFEGDLNSSNSFWCIPIKSGDSIDAAISIEAQPRFCFKPPIVWWTDNSQLYKMVQLEVACIMSDMVRFLNQEKISKVTSIKNER